MAVPRTEPWAVAIHDQNVIRAQQDQSPVIFLGDSITYHWGDKDRTDTGSVVWNAQIAPFHAEDFGIVSDVTQNVLWQIENGELDGHPKVVVLLIGTNNLGGIYQTPQETASGVAAIVQEIRTISPTTKVLLMGLFPRGALPSDPLRAEVSQTNALIANLADGQDVRFLDLGSQLVQVDGTILQTVMVDFLHLNIAGYQIWANAIAVPLQQMLGLPSIPTAATTGATSATDATQSLLSTSGDPSLLVPLPLDLTSTSSASSAPTSSASTSSHSTHPKIDLVGGDPSAP
ncbi:MAG TPA: GDSL-type esterase/lipase family protein [Isosphaeraceae bacterium]|nr:GDSL-type esterase/lipase family protein [Isosphaeraceae bacterium]